MGGETGRIEGRQWIKMAKCNSAFWYTKNCIFEDLQTLSYQQICEFTFWVAIRTGSLTLLQKEWFKVASACVERGGEGGQGWFESVLASY